MRAISYDSYTYPTGVQLTDQPQPKVAPGEVLIKVHYASVNPVDWKLMAGGLDAMIDTIFPVIPGWDVSGEVAALGPDVPEFTIGDRVASYARKDVAHGGTYAEYVSVPATSVAAIPDGVNSADAAALPLVGLTALRSLEALEVSEGDVVLIHAASGGVGHIAAQLARLRGATVIGSASAANQQKLRDISVVPVEYGEGLVDALRAQAPDGVDAVADFVGGVMNQTAQVLKSGTRHVSIADETVEKHGGHWIWVRPDGARLATLLELLADSSLQIPIDTTYPLADAAEALQRSQNGANGKILIQIS